MAIDIDGAMRRSVQKFYAGKSFDNSDKLEKMRYTKDFFDGFEKELRPKATKKTEKVEEEE